MIKLIAVLVALTLQPARWGPDPLPRVWEVRIGEGFDNITWKHTSKTTIAGFVLTQERRVKHGNEWVWQPPRFNFVLEPSVRSTCMAREESGTWFYMYSIRTVSNWTNEGINFSFKEQP